VSLDKNVMKGTEHFVPLQTSVALSEGLSSQTRGQGWVLTIAYLLQIILEKIIGNVVISEVDAPTHAVLSKAEKQVPYGELVNTTECITL
jgi:hypothetical protein